MELRSLPNRLMNASLRSVLRKTHLIQEPPDLRRIPTVLLAEILQSRPVIRVDGTYTYVDGSLPWCDLLPILSIAVDRKPQSVAEIGTLHGHTTRLLAINLPNAQINTIDLPENSSLEHSSLPKDDFHLIRERRLGEAFRSDVSITNVTQLLGDTATMMFPKAELFYIDGSHTYEYVRNDTLKAMAIDEAKTIIWHDCDPPHTGVTRWLREMVDMGNDVRRIKDTNVAVLYR